MLIVLLLGCKAAMVIGSAATHVAGREWLALPFELFGAAGVDSDSPIAAAAARHQALAVVVSREYHSARGITVGFTFRQKSLVANTRRAWACCQRGRWAVSFPFMLTARLHAQRLESLNVARRFPLFAFQ